VFATAGMMLPEALVLSRVESRDEIAKEVVVAADVVEFPVITRLPLIVEEALERKPPVRVERPVTPRVEEKVAAPV